MIISEIEYVSTTMIPTLILPIVFINLYTPQTPVLWDCPLGSNIGRCPSILVVRTRSLLFINMIFLWYFRVWNFWSKVNAKLSKMFTSQDFPFKQGNEIMARHEAGNLHSLWITCVLHWTPDLYAVLGFDRVSIITHYWSQISAFHTGYLKQF